AKRAGSDHAAQTFTATVDADGRFALPLAGLRPDTYRLRLQSMHVNGAMTQQSLELTIDRARGPDLNDLQAQWSVVRAKRAIFAGDPEARRFLVDPELASDKTGQTRRGLAVLHGVVTPPAPVELDRVTASRVYLSDAAWLEARVGWGEPTRNTFWFSDKFNRGIFLFLKDRLYDKGLYAHADSSYVFATGGNWKTLTATVGLRDGASKQGSAIFAVLGDGREVYRSALLRAGESAEVKADITGVKRLELVAKGGEGHTSNAWAVWLDPQVSR
ncbi:MAG TPA: NPCBM/NEW2 domain-containing protein, partial [Opitutaceae bacterium]